MAPPRLTVGIVGLGFGRAHIPAFQAHGCEIVAVCQRDRAAAAAVARAYGVPGVYERWEDLLDRARPDIVSIATPPHLHHAIALRALGAGAHVLCEKPLAASVDEARAMVEAAARAGRVAMTCFNWRFTEAMRRFTARVEAGALGRVFHVAARWLGPRWASEGAAPTWRMDRGQAGHGAMGDMGVHLVDLVRSHFGEFARVAAQAGIAYPSRTVPGGGRAADAEDYCAVVGELASGAQVTLAVSRVAHGVSEHTLEAFGSAGALAYRLDREGPRWWEGELRAAAAGATLATVPPEDPPGPVPAGDPLDVTGATSFAGLVGRLLEGIRAGRTPSPSLQDGLRAQMVLDAIRESAQGGGWVAVRPSG